LLGLNAIASKASHNSDAMPATREKGRKGVMEAEQLKKITGFFIEEAKEHLETIEEGVTHLQATIDDPEQVTEVYRGAHSIKGGAAMLELESIRKTAHRLEDYFKILKEHSVTVDSTLGGFLNPIYRGLQTLVADLEQNYKVSPETEKQVMTTLDPLFDQTEVYLNSLLTPASEAKTGKEPSLREDNQDLPDSGEFLDNLITSNFTLESNYQSDRYKTAEPLENSQSHDLGMDELSTLANLFESDGTDMDQTLADTDSDLKLLSELTGGDFGNEDITSDREEVDDFLDQLMDSGDFDASETQGDSNEDLAFLDGFDLDSEETTSTSPPTGLSSSLDSLEALFSEDADVKPLPPQNGKNVTAATPPKKAHPEEVQGIGKDTNHDLDSLFGDFGQSNSDLLDSQTPDMEMKADEDNLAADFDLGLGDFGGDSLESENDSAALFEDLFATSNSESTAEEDLADIFS
jgi:chemotaxis protein histidine kinase CheA